MRDYYIIDIFKTLNFFSFKDTSKFSNVLKAKEDLQKSAEQLEKEKREILGQRIPKLQLEGQYKYDLQQIVIEILLTTSFQDLTEID